MDLLLVLTFGSKAVSRLSPSLDDASSVFTSLSKSPKLVVSNAYLYVLTISLMNEKTKFFYLKIQIQNISDRTTQIESFMSCNRPKVELYNNAEVKDFAIRVHFYIT